MSSKIWVLLIRNGIFVATVAIQSSTGLYQVLIPISPNNSTAIFINTERIGGIYLRKRLRTIPVLVEYIYGYNFIPVIVQQ
jgi:hypothetical protein